MVAILLDIRPGDEVIVPSYAFVTTANAFASRGAKIVFADSRPDYPAIDEEKVEGMVSGKTKAIVALHYAGIACNMEPLLHIANRHGICLVEDNAQGLGSSYRGQNLGGIGHIGALSFHETKNVHCGEGGAIIINTDGFQSRVEHVWDMGTDRKEFKEGLVNSYGWVDLGGSFYPSELNAAFLYAQLLRIQQVNEERKSIWNRYYQEFASLENVEVGRPKVPQWAEHNGHTFYLITRSLNERNELIAYLKNAQIQAAFHFQSLHRSAYGMTRYAALQLPNADMYSERLVRLPLHLDLDDADVARVLDEVKRFYR
jgi:dTDP-4-amino-4,6-dideoxygalactose transaminase